MRTFLSLLAILGSTCSFVYAGPPFNPRAALDWCVDTVVSPVPVAKRIYVLGPDKTREAYGLNGGFAYHDLETRQAVECTEGMTLAELCHFLPRYSGDFDVSVWRVLLNPVAEGENRPVYTTRISQASVSKIVLQPNDIVEISRPVPGLRIFQ